MTDEGPILESLTRRLAECPPEFLLPPRSVARPDGVAAVAVLSDHLRAMGVEPSSEHAAAWAEPGSPAAENRLRLLAVAAWMLHDDWFLARPRLGPATADLLSRGLDLLAEVVRADDAVADEDRREELARVCLAGLGLRPSGETPPQAADRLAAIDSAGRLRVLREARAAEARARKIRERMARDAARAAAARYSSE